MVDCTLTDCTALLSALPIQIPYTTTDCLIPITSFIIELVFVFHLAIALVLCAPGQTWDRIHSMGTASHTCTQCGALLYGCLSWSNAHDRISSILGRCWITTPLGAVLNKTFYCCSVCLAMSHYRLLWSRLCHDNRRISNCEVRKCLILQNASSERPLIRKSLFWPPKGGAILQWWNHALWETVFVNN